MLYLLPQSTDVYFNLAAEEYLLKNFSDDIFLLWQNKPAVVVGKFQNILAEINSEYARQANIQLARRLTGGGAVYHDAGNLNFTFIENRNMPDFSLFARRMTGFLGSLGIDVEVDNRNALFLNGFKISGSAQCIHKDRVLFHGTLLFSSELEKLSMVLENKLVKYNDKAVQSVRNQVCNMQDFIPQKTDIANFKHILMQAFLQENPDAVLYQYSAHDIEEINRLKQEKYASWDWIFGRSPSYAFSKPIKLDNNMFEVSIKVTDGFINSVDFSGDGLQPDKAAQLSSILNGCRHDAATIKAKLLNSLAIPLWNSQELKQLAEIIA